MKTVKIHKTGGVERLSDQTAEQLVAKGAASYIPKKAFKSKDLGERALQIHQQSKREARQV